MTTEELEQFRKALVLGKNKQLEGIYSEYREGCSRFIATKGYCSLEKAKEHFTEAILILRSNIISRKVTELTNVKSYLISICINLARNENYKEKRKADKLRLLIKEKSYNIDKGDSLFDDRIEICKQALSQLTERCQQILTAFYVHKAKMKEIAEDLELSSADVAKTLKMRCYKSWIAAAKNLAK